jgi:hypothetical protein
MSHLKSLRYLCFFLPINKYAFNENEILNATEHQYHLLRSSRVFLNCLSDIIFIVIYLVL